MRSISRLLAFALLSLASIGGITPARGATLLATRYGAIKTTGDVFAYALPVAAFGFTLAIKDRDGSWQMAESAAVSMGVTFALKYSVRSTRPNGEPHGFPSGHATISFSAAEFMRMRYGWKFGLPAYAFATFVAISRVHAHEHYTRDVVAGAMIGVASSYFISKPYHGWDIQPVVGLKSYGISASRGF